VTSRNICAAWLTSLHDIPSSWPGAWLGFRAPGAVGRLDRYLNVIRIVPVIALLVGTQGSDGKSLSKSFHGLGG